MARGKLRQTFDRIRQEPGLGRNMIALAVVTAVGIGAGSYMLVQQRFDPPWQDDTLVYATFQEAGGVAEGVGQEIRISGVDVGNIRETRVNSDGNAEVLMAIDQDNYDRPIYQDATVVLRPKSPLNDMYIEVNPGTSAAEPVEQEGVLPVENSESPLQFDQPLRALDDNTRDAATSLLSASDTALARAPEDLPAGLAATDTVLENLQPVVQQLDERRDNLETLITSVSQFSQTLGEDDERLIELANSMQDTLSSVSGESDALREAFAELPGFTDELGDAAEAVDGLGTQLDPTLDNVRAASETLPDSLARATDTINQLDGVVDSADPVAEQLGPLAEDLRPFVGDATSALEDATPITAQLNPITTGLVEYMPDLEAFMHQTNSLTSLRDANGGILRGLIQGGPSTVPLEGTDDFAPTPR